MIEDAPATAVVGHNRLFANGGFRVGYPLRIGQHRSNFMSRNFKPRLFQPHSGLTVRLVMTVICSGAFALYAVGTDWYWVAFRQLPSPFVSSVLARVRSLLADDTSVAERQAEFYAAWFVVCCVAFLGWIAAAAFRRIWLQRKPNAA